MGSPFIRDAIDRRSAIRDEYEHILDAAYQRAELDCNARLLNRRGEQKGIRPLDLFMSNTTFARAYASEELLEHWQHHPRPTFAAYERQRFKEIVDGPDPDDEDDEPF